MTTTTYPSQRVKPRKRRKRHIIARQPVTTRVDRLSQSISEHNQWVVRNGVIITVRPTGDHETGFLRGILKEIIQSLCQKG